MQDNKTNSQVCKITKICVTIVVGICCLLGVIGFGLGLSKAEQMSFGQFVQKNADAMLTYLNARDYSATGGSFADTTATANGVYSGTAYTADGKLAEAYKVENENKVSVKGRKVGDSTLYTVLCKKSFIETETTYDADENATVSVNRKEETMVLGYTVDNDEIHYYITSETISQTDDNDPVTSAQKQELADFDTYQATLVEVLQTFNETIYYDFGYFMDEDSSYLCDVQISQKGNVCEASIANQMLEYDEGVLAAKATYNVKFIDNKLANQGAKYVVTNVNYAVENVDFSQITYTSDATINIAEQDDADLIDEFKNLMAQMHFGFGG